MELIGTDKTEFEIDTIVNEKTATPVAKTKKRLEVVSLVTELSVLNHPIKGSKTDTERNKIETMPVSPVKQIVPTTVESTVSKKKASISKNQFDVDEVWGLVIGNGDYKTCRDQPGFDSCGDLDWTYQEVNTMHAWLRDTMKCSKLIELVDSDH
jgi:hypothetical protein